MIHRRLLLACPWLMTTACTHPVRPDRQFAATFELPARSRPLRAWVALPQGYDAAPLRQWPLLVFLHGSGERGEDLALVKVHGPPRLVDAGQDWPFVLCSPQLEAGARWNPQDLHALRSALCQRWRIDDRRVCATGLSLGGRGVWDWARAFPDDLAGIAPVCGYADPARACRARPVPVRAYHGDADTVVPLARQQASVDAHRACGGSVDFIVYPGVGHDAWTPAYQDPALMPWLLARQRA